MPKLRFPGLMLLTASVLYITVLCTGAVSSETAPSSAGMSQSQIYLLFCKAAYLENNNQLAEAKKLYEQILEHNPNIAYVNYKLGALHLTYSEIDVSIDFLEKALHFDPALTPAYNLLARKYRYQNKTDQVIRIY